jgi:hypothetical protein
MISRYVKFKQQFGGDGEMLPPRNLSRHTYIPNWSWAKLMAISEGQGIAGALEVCTFITNLTYYPYFLGLILPRITVGILFHWCIR